MGRKKGDEIEALENEIRELKKINRVLHKRLKKVDRDFRDNPIIEDESLPPPKPRKIMCPKCHESELITKTLANRKYTTCSDEDCGYREKAEKIE